MYNINTLHSFIGTNSIIYSLKKILIHGKKFNYILFYLKINTSPGQD